MGDPQRPAEFCGSIRQRHTRPHSVCRTGCFSHSSANTDAQPQPCSHANPETHPFGDADAYRNAGAVPIPHVYAEAYTYAEAYAYAEAHAHAEAYAYACPHADSLPDEL